MKDNENELENINVDVNSTMLVGGHFHILVESPDGSSRECEFDNLITNNGLNFVGNGGLPLQMYAGSGNTAPAFTDTQLQAILGSSTAKGGAVAWATSYTASSGGVPAYMQYSYAFVFPQGSATGVWAEIASGYASTNLFSRSLLKDSGGTPITMTVVAEEQVTVTYTIRLYFPLVTTGTVTNLTVNGIPYTFTTRPHYSGGNNYQYTIMGNYSGARNSWTAFHSVTGMGALIESGLAGAVSMGNISGNTFIVSAYVANSYEQSWTISATISQGNSNPISGVLCAPFTYGTGEILCWIQPPITKLNTQTLSFTFKITWARYP